MSSLRRTPNTRVARSICRSRGEDPSAVRGDEGGVDVRGQDVPRLGSDVRRENGGAVEGRGGARSRTLGYPRARNGNGRTADLYRHLRSERPRNKFVRSNARQKLRAYERDGSGRNCPELFIF
jgi:hypothetical protein